MIKQSSLKRLAPVVLSCLILACNSGSSIEKTTDADTTITMVDTAGKYDTKDSVARKADSNKQIIDSSLQVLKDSIHNTK